MTVLAPPRRVRDPFLIVLTVLPAACLWFGPARAPQDLPVPPDVPQPREEPGVPSAAAQPENPVS